MGNVKKGFSAKCSSLRLHNIQKKIQTGTFAHLEKGNALVYNPEYSFSEMESACFPCP